ncbi:hypothetical protein BU14_0401s0008 [Porphyra umbilicalis]|uniref:Kinesin motor domain-containing protein n=1 Tax=Porphyra umbilicalis TaxID=2786 RepID=A0A1X6NW68_PORUM|nr:hypothetical protein BU14_0401s0008 [Porphyra umbilicalis]|eukprot:OSX72837.1 hypothetical protein BU14_0401s0008 [Porphyra umbilicalis]
MVSLTAINGGAVEPPLDDGSPGGVSASSVDDALVDEALDDADLHLGGTKSSTAGGSGSSSAAAAAAAAAAVAGATAAAAPPGGVLRREVTLHVLETVNSRVENIGSIILLLRKQLSRLKDALERETLSRVASDALVERHSDKIASLRRQRRGLRQKVVEEASRADSLADRVSSVLAERDRLIGEVRTAQAAHAASAAAAAEAAATSSVSAASAAEEARAEELVRELESTKAARDGEVAALLREMASVKGEMATESSRALAAATEQVRAVTAQRDSAVAEAEAATARVSELESGNNRQVLAVADLERKVRTLQDQLGSNNHEMTSLRRQSLDDEVERRRLHNQVQELKGNIRVYCRVRPLLLKGAGVGDAAGGAGATSASGVFKYHSRGRGIDAVKPGDGPATSATGGLPPVGKWSFAFDRVFDGSASQGDVFAEVSEMVQSALDGFRVCIFAYGQSGSGKTHTMLSSANGDELGVIPRAVSQIFDHTERMAADGWKFELKASFMEVYNEQVRDLLGAADEDPNVKYDVKFDAATKLCWVTNLTTATVNSREEVDNVIQTSLNNRSTASTRSNERSSRSHCVFRLHIAGANNHGGNVSGLLNLIDLAGSERVKVSGAAGARMREAQAINKSLSALGDVIAALANKDKHIPFRNSKLTYFLQDSLGGDSKTLMFVNLSPSSAHFSESLCSLRFAQKVNACEIGRAGKSGRVSLGG